MEQYPRYQLDHKFSGCHYVFSNEYQIIREWLLPTPLLFLAVVVFGSMCFSRDWLMYPNFNYISWSYGFAVIAMFSHAAAGALLLLNFTASFTLCIGSSRSKKKKSQEQQPAADDCWSFLKWSWIYLNLMILPLFKNLPVASMLLSNAQLKNGPEFISDY
ncbi:unnamed protein product [Darwinula stevensoni]|uniref:Uncharacterized protein n=1 Tax=Darwinula stevensoni TaxID=69355 RepID=A0A7R8X6R5_9CRUS|nr:unnamed protein product [Darwinula stevensoni]CAG0886162.1 unnamed protein product [Darwinula stevensoni]